MKFILQGLEKRGIYRTTIKRIPKFCKQAGLTDISIHHMLIPMGTWGGQVGKLMLDNVLNASYAYREFVVRHGIFNDMKSEWDDHVEKLADEVNENRCTVNAYVFTGRKPIVNEHENGLIDDELFSDDEMNENNALQRMKNCTNIV